MDRGAWRATVHGVAQSRTCLKQLSTHARPLWVSWEVRCERLLGGEEPRHTGPGPFITRIIGLRSGLSSLLVRTSCDPARCGQFTTWAPDTGGGRRRGEGGGCAEAWGHQAGGRDRGLVQLSFRLNSEDSHLKRQGQGTESQLREQTRWRSLSAARRSSVC